MKKKLGAWRGATDTGITGGAKGIYDGASKSGKTEENTDNNGRASKCLDAVIVALNQTFRDSGSNDSSSNLHYQRQPASSWFESTTSLQLVSLDLCLACRDLIAFRVRVAHGTPRRLWAALPTITSTSAERKNHTGFSETSRFPSGGSCSGSWTTLKIVHSSSVVPRSPKIDPETPHRSSVIPRSLEEEIECSSTKTPARTGTTCSSEIPEESTRRVLVLPWRMTPKENRKSFVFSLCDIAHGCISQKDVLGTALCYPETDRRRSTEIMKKNLTATADEGSLRPRVPAVRAQKVLWEKPTAALAESILPNVEELEFGDAVRDSNGSGLNGVVWPRILKRLVFGRLFNRPLRGVTWPPLLEELTTGCCFDQAIDADNVQWPRALRKLTFGFRFDQTIREVKWPETLQQLEFGHCFNRPVRATRWPQSLQKLTFGCNFDQEVEGTSWPDSLQEIHFGNRFNRRIERIKWPDSLQILGFGEDFNQSVENVLWPELLEALSFGHEFDRPLRDAKFPLSLVRLEFGYRFNQAIAGVKWPAALRHLTFGCLFDQDIDGVVWPSDLLQITFGGAFNRAVDKVVWPSSLQQLAFGSSFNQEVDSIMWPASLQRLTFGYAFNQRLENVIWPPSLETLALGCSFNHPLDASIDWPRSLRKITLGKCFNGSLSRVVWPENIQELVLMFSYKGWRNSKRKSLMRVQWPAGLRKLTVTRGMSLRGMVLPPRVQLCYFSKVHH